MNREKRVFGVDTLQACRPVSALTDHDAIARPVSVMAKNGLKTPVLGEKSHAQYGLPGAGLNVTAPTAKNKKTDKSVFFSQRSDESRD
jgi:hypothetical protein